MRWKVFLIIFFSFVISFFLIRIYVSAMGVSSNDFTVGSYIQGLAGGQASNSQYDSRVLFGYQQGTSNVNSPDYQAFIGSFISTLEEGGGVVVTPPTTAPSGGGGGGCTYNWVCSEWYPNICSEGIQKRVCINKGTCTGTAGLPDLNQTCNISELSEPLFDINLKVLSKDKEIFPGGTLKANVSLINVGKIMTLDIFLKYWIVDSKNNIIAEIRETKAESKKDQFGVNFRIPENTSLGNYRIYSQINYYTNKTALAGDYFQIVANKFLPLITSTIFVLTIMIISVLIILTVIALIRKIKITNEEGYVYA